MTLDKVISYCLEQSKDCTECANEYFQLVLWLEELKMYRELADENKLIYSYMYSRDEKNNNK
jgi:hypothetical protein